VQPSCEETCFCPYKGTQFEATRARAQCSCVLIGTDILLLRAPR
jgi:hypothetical protein